MKRILFMAFLGMLLSMPSFAQNNTRNSRGGHNYNANRYNLNHWTNNDFLLWIASRIGYINRQFG